MISEGFDFGEEDFTEDGFNKRGEIFGDLYDILELEDLPFYRKIEERRWFADYVAHYRYLYDHFKNKIN